MIPVVLQSGSKGFEPHGVGEVIVGFTMGCLLLFAGIIISLAAYNTIKRMYVILTEEQTEISNISDKNGFVKVKGKVKDTDGCMPTWLDDTECRN